MSLVARVKSPRSDRVGGPRRRRRHKLNVVERIWAYQTMKELRDKALWTTDDTARTTIMAAVQQIGSEVIIDWNPKQSYDMQPHVGTLHGSRATVTVFITA